ncbi:branched-chain amino acid ABC transporter ATP-binding protein [Candidatus Marsarchaeota G2 archaeon ECH_B_2]|uniref:Branched-chain amino acid ABC transporter ATP-binding protein n=3 Tax=Candidatus Marsarchaeota group 2 TaxID=2203771 RepID=A0A2R6B6Y5_9ARCH|nr:MAG: branched-chain amino acid ABC transporter ATP-binding protein [Candidatus Marsarchaeota G2 archaeon ECH_B_2]PSN98852.1 MAG: branched-chain amino acid ABC transporter ATP-binding protein [Candidatus Marsarchaeota G2 archaeon ECH_B_3]PSO00855.1 MAG: branched-chain amino acid ABC transporter ATP-binding protein [Candidatus Marsarchaeota G2 archaeon ECH_B_1]
MGLLEARGIETSYGSTQVLFGVNLAAEENKVTCVIGPNGAGKTTLLLTLAGILQAKRGDILFDGERLNDLPAWERVKKGVVLCPERRRLFPSLSVLENLTQGAYTRNDTQDVRDTLEEVFTLFPILKERRSQLAGTLSGGEQQMVAIGRSLMSHPKLLMLDEPSVGLSPLMRSKIFEQILRIRDMGSIAIVLVEQDAADALEISDYAYVLEDGKITIHGAAVDVAANPEVRAAYLGL